MKNFWAKIWIPALLVTAAALQSFGIDIRRAYIYEQVSDSLSHILTADTSANIFTSDTLQNSDSTRPQTDSLVLRIDSLNLNIDSLETRTDSLETDTVSKGHNQGSGLTQRHRSFLL